MVNYQVYNEIRYLYSLPVYIFHINILKDPVACKCLNILSFRYPRFWDFRFSRIRLYIYEQMVRHIRN